MAYNVLICFIGGDGISVRDMAIDALRVKYPNRHIIYLDKVDSCRERANFNMDILKGALCGKCALKVEPFEEFALLVLDGSETRELFWRLITRCAIVGELTDTGVRIFPSGNTCDIMSAVCRILREFEK